MPRSHVIENARLIIRILRGRVRCPTAFIAALALVLCLAQSRSVLAGNVIFFIGDGMGFEQVRAARYFAGEPLFLETLPSQAECTTYSANSSVTDSAAAATALATGRKVNNGVISLAYPGDGTELQTLLELAQAYEMKVGLVTTAFLTHATPAAFGAHESSRNNYTAIAADYLQQSRPNILFGGGGNGLTPSASLAAGYQVATDTATFLNLDASQSLLTAQFGASHLPYEADYLSSSYPYPHLADLVESALRILETHPKGFFLMVEGGRIDHACHANNIVQAIHETLAFSIAVQKALAWAAQRRDTLILVTADHETGGLSVIRNNGAAAYPDVTWASTGHSGVNVPIYAWGFQASAVTGVLDNTQLFSLCQSVLQQSPPTPPSPPANFRVTVGAP